METIILAISDDPIPIPPPPNPNDSSSNSKSTTITTTMNNEKVGRRVPPLQSRSDILGIPLATGMNMFKRQMEERKDIIEGKDVNDDDDDGNDSKLLASTKALYYVVPLKVPRLKTTQYQKNIIQL
jgi:hypothetical protein